MSCLGLGGCRFVLSFYYRLHYLLINQEKSKDLRKKYSPVKATEENL